MSISVEHRLQALFDVVDLAQPRKYLARQMDGHGLGQSWPISEASAPRCKAEAARLASGTPSPQGFLDNYYGESALDLIS